MTFFQFMNKNVHVSAVHIAFFRSITEEGWQIRIVSSANGLFIYIETNSHSEPLGAHSVSHARLLFTQENCKQTTIIS